MFGRTCKLLYLSISGLRARQPHNGRFKILNAQPTQYEPSHKSQHVLFSTNMYDTTTTTMKTTARSIVSLLLLSVVLVSGQDPTASPAPSSIPSDVPTSTETPSVSPSTLAPTDAPSAVPSVMPSLEPSVFPSLKLSNDPSTSPSLMPSTAESVNPTEIPSIDPSIDPSMAPSMASNPPTLSANPSQPPSLVASIAPTTSIPPTTALASNNPSPTPSSSVIPSSLPTITNLPTATVFDCEDDPIFTQLEPDVNGNATDCDWFDFYDFNSCQDFGDWLDPDGNTANQACCTCGGGILLLPSSAPSQPPSQPPTTTAPTTSPPKTDRCGCASCTNAVWARRTINNGPSCGARMEFLQSIEGGSVAEEDACYQIGHDEFPDECFPCDSQHCNNPEQHHHCDCPSCTDDIWRRDAGAATCGERMEFLQQTMGALEACQQIGASEFPNICGECNPSTCGMSSNTSSRNAPSAALWMVGSSSALVLLLTLIMT